MTTRLILLAALLCWAAPAAGQTVKSLGFNTTNGRVVAATNLVWTNAFSFSTNTVAGQVRTNLGLGALNNVQFAEVVTPSLGVGLGMDSYFSANSENVETALPIEFGNNSAGGTRTNLGLGTFKTTSEDSFSEMYSGSDLRVQAGDIILFYEAFSFGGTNAENYKSQSRISLGIPLAALTNTSNVTTMRALAGSTNTNEPYSGTVALTNTNVLTFSNGVLLNIQ